MRTWAKLACRRAHAPQTASTYILGWVNTHVLRLDTRAHTQLCAFVRASCDALYVHVYTMRIRARVRTPLSAHTNTCPHSQCRCPCASSVCIERLQVCVCTGNRRRHAHEGSGNEPVNPHDVGSVLSHGKLIGEVFCTTSDHPETMTLNFSP